MPESVLAWTVAGLACILLAIFVWRGSNRPIIRAALVTIASSGIALAMSGNPLSILLILVGLILIVVTWCLAIAPGQKQLGMAWIGLLVLILSVTRLTIAAPFIGPAIWIGVSYLFLRLIHVVLDARQGRLGDMTLPEMVVFTLHPATLVAGPIDRSQHSVAEQRRPPNEPVRYMNDGVWRLMTGVFKKMVLANAFYALIVAYDAIEATTPLVGAWIWVIAYSFYLYFDFAAYSDVAIGVGLLLGLRLPENFANPYMQPTITQFWQSWHISLSTWLRDYVFFPTSRYLLKRWGSRFSPLIVLLSHLATMMGSGLWHGFRPELVAWGLWHGLGLFAHNRWTILRRRYRLPTIPTPFGIFLTYLFVSLGWLFSRCV